MYPTPLIDLTHLLFLSLTVWSCAGLTSLLTALLSSAGGLAFLEADAQSVRLLMDVLSPGMSTAPLLLLRDGEDHVAAGCVLFAA